MCLHRTCANIHKRRRKAGYYRRAGVGIVYLTEFQGQCVIGLGYERFGQYQYTYNICAGKMEPVDNDCFLNTVIRELKEEFKISLSYASHDPNSYSFDRIFKSSSGQIRYFLHNGTPIFIGLFPDYRPYIQFQMTADISNPSLSSSHKEMSHFEYFNCQTLLTPRGTSLPISPFANAVIKQLQPSLTFFSTII